MPIDPKIKNRAYEIDPECWVSYSGKPRHFKQGMDERRTAVLRAAALEIHNKRLDEIEKDQATAMREVLEDLVRTCSGSQDNWLLHEIRRVIDNAKDVLEGST